MVATLIALAALAGAGELELVEAGSAPRSVVRYAPAVGSAQTVRLEMDVDMEMSMAGMAMPAMDVPTVFYELRTEVGAVEASGIRYSYTVTAAGAEGEGPVSEALNKELAEAVGSAGALAIDARGRSTAGSTEAAGTPVSQMESALGKLSLVLPEQAIGAGASWRLREEVLEGGVAVQQTSTWTLAEIRADGGLVIDVAVRQLAEPQALTNEQGDTSKLLAFSSEGSGRTVVHPARLVPLEADMKVQTEMRAESAMAGTAMTVDTKLAQHTRLREK